jgi:hypothetical protein
VPEKMEAFTEYLVRSLREKGGWARGDKTPLFF